MPFIIAVMQVVSLKKKFYAELKELYDESEIKSLTKNALMYSLEISATDILVKTKVKLNGSQIHKAEEVLHRLKAFEPFQYITGETEFLGLKFKVNKNVLIPRPETEELVEWILNEIKDLKLKAEDNFKILDIGTGSGCIAIALKKNLASAEITAIDISKDALKVARDNAIINNVKINFQQKDILKSIPGESKDSFDLIVSNPPYISQHEKSQMHRNVTDHEPHIALFVEGKNPLLFYEHISELASGRLLKPHGRLYFEMNESLSREIFELPEMQKFADVIIKTDLSGKQRMIRIIKK